MTAILCTLSAILFAVIMLIGFAIFMQWMHWPYEVYEELEDCTEANQTPQKWFGGSEWNRNRKI